MLLRTFLVVSVCKNVKYVLEWKCSSAHHQSTNHYFVYMKRYESFAEFRISTSGFSIISK